ncbi:oligosaccharyl transferase delta subunit [Clavulina sp. PMI_390]|nr:oligosaccharyl transferase delta subunit [Clavulina sp. PMI_390]
MRMMRSSVALCILSGLLSTASAKLTVKVPKYSVVSDVGSVLASDPLDVSTSSLPTVSVGKSDILKLTFTVVDDDESGDNGVQPHQAFLRFHSSTGEEGIQPIRVPSSGKAKFDLNARRPPPGIPATSDDTVLTVDLILGSFTRKSSTVPLLKLKLPASMPVAPHPEELLYHAKPLISHTFRGEQKMPPKVISLVFAAVALSPWVVLAGLLSFLPIHYTPSSATAPFIALLAAFEGLLIWYWIDLKIGQVLSYGAVLALITAAAGKRALASL